jgi:hypothetical protein
LCDSVFEGRKYFMPQCPEDEYKVKRAERERKQQDLLPTPLWWLGQRDPIARYTLYLGLLTLGLVIVGTLQWCSALGQLAEIKETRIEAGNATRLDQRAWVGVRDAISVPGSFTETSAWRVNMIFANSGKSPARGAKIAALSLISPVSISGPSPDQIKALEFQPTQAIAPQGTYNFAIGTAADLIATTVAKKGEMESLISKYPLIKSGQLILYYFGILRYEDNSGAIHDTQFCIYMANPQTQVISFCRDFNDLN